MLSETHQSAKATYCMVSTIRHSGKGRTVKRSVVVGVRWKEGMNIQNTEDFRAVKVFCMVL